MHISKRAHNALIKALGKTSFVDEILVQAEQKRGRTAETDVLPSGTDARSVLEGISHRPSPCFRKRRFQYPATCDLSVIVPVYNTEQYVGECIDSILSQDGNYDMELIAINDGSTDDSFAILQSRAESDSRVRVINQENQGFSGARNVGIDCSRGKAICFVDSDDMLAQGHLNALWRGLAEGRGEFVSGAYSKMREDGRVLGPSKGPRTHGGPCSRLYRREQWSDIRFPEGFWFEDTLIAYCIQSRFAEGFVDDAGYLRRIRSGSITSTHAQSPKALDSFWVVEEMLDWCRELGIPLGSVYRQTVVQFGSLLWDRVGLLGDYERRCLFVCCCSLLEQVFGEMKYAGLLDPIDGRLAYLERSLWGRNFSLWEEACKWVR